MSHTPVTDNIQSTLHSRHILCHLSVPDEYAWVTPFVSIETQRRSMESASRPQDLVAFEKGCHDVAVGNMRRYFQREMVRYIEPVDEFLDYGCGGPWWKEGYWHIPKRVTGIEINPAELLHLREQYPDSERYRLVFTPSGISEFQDNSFDLILSSSVIGYILPSQAKIHVREMFRLTRPGGVAIFSRIAAANVGMYFKGNKFREGQPGLFFHAYTMPEFKALVRSAGFSVVEAKTLGLRIPISPSVLQALYGRNWMLRLDRVMNAVLPLVGIHHLLVAKKG